MRMPARFPKTSFFSWAGHPLFGGFDENLLRFDSAGKGVGGLTAILGNIETRIDLGPNFEVSFFYDIGSVRNAVVEAGSDEFRSSVGDWIALYHTNRSHGGLLRAQTE